MKEIYTYNLTIHTKFNDQYWDGFKCILGRIRVKLSKKVTAKT